MPRSILAQNPICPRTPSATPRVLTRASGAYVHDIDGQQWVDFDNARGSVLLGHGDPVVAEAVARAAGGECGATTGWSPLVDSVLDRLSTLCGAPVVGLFRTGTAAVRAAVSAVRTSSGRRLVLSAGYHGYDEMWTPAREPVSPNADGIIDFLYDLDLLVDWLHRAGSEIAAVVVSVDPIHHDQGWYARLREAVAGFDVAVVLDEVKSGLRLRPGLFVEPDTLRPDVWVVSKGLANGHPIAAVGGDPTVLKPLRAMGYTSFFEPTTLAAADATLARMTTGDVQRGIQADGDRFVGHARTALAAGGVPIDIAGTGPLFQFVCADQQVEEAFHAAAAEENLMFYEGDHQAPSAALTAAALDDACARFTRVAEKLAGRWPDVAVTTRARYLAAWNEMCGLPDLPRTAAETQEWIKRLSAAG